MGEALKNFKNFIEIENFHINFSIAKFQSDFHKLEVFVPIWSKISESLIVLFGELVWMGKRDGAPTLQRAGEIFNFLKKSEYSYEYLNKIKFEMKI